MSVSRETELFAGYAALVRKWNPSVNLIAPSTMDQLESRHISDSKQLADLSRNSQGCWLDLGSGGGFPGIVMAIARPDLQVTLLESDQRKAAFLRNVIRELGLRNTAVLNQRIEQAKPICAAQVSARALAPLGQLMAYVERHLDPQGTAWLMKGRNWQSEVDEARRDWKFELKPHQSTTDHDAAILEITGIRHA